MTSTTMAILVGIAVAMIVVHLTLGAQALTIEEAYEEQQRSERLTRSVAVEEEQLLFQGYDCSGPANLTTLRATDNLNCQVKEEGTEQRKRHYALLHHATSTRFSITHCTMARSRMVYHCGSAGHTALAPLEWQLNRPVHMSRHQCQRALTEGYLTMLPDDNPSRTEHYGKWRINMNGTTYISEHVAGETTGVKNDVWCHGHEYEYRVMNRYKPFQRIGKGYVVVDHYRFTIHQETATVNREGIVTAYNRQLILPCQVDRETCKIGEETYIWQKPSREDTCPYYLSRDVQGIEVTDENGEDVFVSSDGSMIRLKRGQPRSRCGGVLYETEFPNLFLIDHDQSLGIPEFRRPLHESEMSLATYTNQQDSFLYNELVEQIQRRMKSAHRQRCQLDKSRRRAQYARRAAEQHAISDGETVHLGNGQFVTAAGAVWYHYRCQPLIVKARATTGCFAALPVQLSEEDFKEYLKKRRLPSETSKDSTTEVPSHTLETTTPLHGSDHLYIVDQNKFFLEPRTHRLLTIATPSVCLRLPFRPIISKQRRAMDGLRRTKLPFSSSS